MTAVAGTLGALGGSGLTAVLVEWPGAFNPMLLSALLPEFAARRVRRPGRCQEHLNEAEMVYVTAVPVNGLPDMTATEQALEDERVIGGGILDGISHVLKSPYLLGIAALMSLFTIASTLLYFQRMSMVARGVLYTVMSRSDKYRARTFNETFVYRFVDQAETWSYTAMGWRGFGPSGLALCLVRQYNTTFARLLVNDANHSLAAVTNRFS